jgi:glucuronoarabinoxylan endo-1,4-beta-xylanase
MMKSSVLAAKYGKEVWMTEHSVSDYVDGRLPNWDEQLDFAQELNECMMSGCTGYIYWYMRAHWSFVGTGETDKYGSGNVKNKLLPRAFVMSHFSKHVTGSTRLGMKGVISEVESADVETTAYIKGDSLIVMALNKTDSDDKLRLRMANFVKSGTHILSTGNEKSKLCQEQDIAFTESTNDVTVSMPPKSLNTYVFMIDHEATAITDLTQTGDEGPKTYYDLQGRRISEPRGLCIEMDADGFTRKIYKKN